MSSEGLKPKTARIVFTSQVRSEKFGLGTSQSAIINNLIKAFVKVCLISLRNNLQTVGHSL
jgi:hypothetical protein